MPAVTRPRRRTAAKPSPARKGSKRVPARKGAKRAAKSGAKKAKKPLSAYNRFVKERYPLIEAKFPGLSFAQISKRVAADWHTCRQANSERSCVSIAKSPSMNVCVIPKRPRKSAGRAKAPVRARNATMRR